jgi:hypothetical protein
MFGQEKDIVHQSVSLSGSDPIIFLLLELFSKLDFELVSLSSPKDPLVKPEDDTKLVIFSFPKDSLVKSENDILE